MTRPVTLRQVEECQAAVAADVAALDADLVPCSQAPAMWTAFDRIERLAASAKVLLARRVDLSMEWKRLGYKSAAEHQARQAGTTVGRPATTSKPPNG